MAFSAVYMQITDGLFLILFANHIMIYFSAGIRLQKTLAAELCRLLRRAQ